MGVFVMYWRQSTFVCVLLLLGFSQAITSLDWYVKHHEDYHFRYNVSDYQITTDEYTVYNLYMRSQIWLTHGEIENGAEEWTHWLQVCVPHVRLPQADTAYLYISGGLTRAFNDPYTTIDPIVSQFAVDTGLIAISLRGVPNEPIVFTGEPSQKQRIEDALIAYTWSHWTNNTAEFDWLLRMPMTKAAVKAMDALQDWANRTADIPPMDRFVVAGASKRGWTTWMVGAMDDPRVIAISPAVAPVANLIPQINEMWESYGSWSFALKDYVDMNLMGWLNLPRFADLLHIIDPLSFPRAMAKIPKYLVNACGDEFFMPDGAQYYWSQLEGAKNLNMVPNADHTLAGKIDEVVGSVEQFALAAYYNRTDILPTYTWEISEDGTTVTINTDATEYIVSVKAYYDLDNPNRDWRLFTCIGGADCTNLRVFKHKELSPVSEGMYSYTIPVPKDGHYSAVMIQVGFDFQWPALQGKSVRPYYITSNVSVAPRGQFPYAPCPQDVCRCGYDCANNYYTPEQ